VCAILVETSESEIEAACGGADDAAVAEAEGGGASPGKVWPDGLVVESEDGRVPTGTTLRMACKRCVDGMVDITE